MFSCGVSVPAPPRPSRSGGDELPHRGHPAPASAEPPRGPGPRAPPCSLPAPAHLCPPFQPGGPHADPACSPAPDLPAARRRAPSSACSPVLRRRGFWKRRRRPEPALCWVPLRCFPVFAARPAVFLVCPCPERAADPACLARHRLPSSWTFLWRRRRRQGRRAEAGARGLGGRGGGGRAPRPGLAAPLVSPSPPSLRLAGGLTEETRAGEPSDS